MWIEYLFNEIRNRENKTDWNSPTWSRKMVLYIPDDMCEKCQKFLLGSWTKYYTKIAHTNTHRIQMQRTCAEKCNRCTSSHAIPSHARQYQSDAIALKNSLYPCDHEKDWSDHGSAHTCDSSSLVNAVTVTDYHCPCRGFRISISLCANCFRCNSCFFLVYSSAVYILYASRRHDVGIWWFINEFSTNFHIMYYLISALTLR